jgi:hypothetical protein
MFVDALKEVSGLLDRRFFIYTFAPALCFAGVLIVVWFAGQERLSAALIAWNQQAPLPKTLELGFFLILTYMFASVLAASSPALLRFYEGYWNFPFAKRLTEFGVRRQRAILDRLDQESQKRSDPEGGEATEQVGAALETIYYYYPVPTFANESVMPTSLGNILKNSELYAYDRYGMNSVLIWPRLYEVFPASFVEEIGAARGNLDFMLLLSTLSVAFALISGVYLVIARADWWLFALCFWGGLLVALIMYRSALNAALAYASTIKVAFDLFRDRLLEQMRLPLPRTQAAERKTWLQVNDLFYQRKPLLVPYERRTPSPNSRTGDAS